MDRVDGLGVAMHEYMKRMNPAMMVELIGKGKVARLDIGHDDYCGVFKGQECNCDPEVIINTWQGKVQVFSDGSIKRLN